MLIIDNFRLQWYSTAVGATPANTNTEVSIPTSLSAQCSGLVQWYATPANTRQYLATLGKTLYGTVVWYNSGMVLRQLILGNQDTSAALSPQPTSSPPADAAAHHNTNICMQEIQIYKY